MTALTKVGRLAMRHEGDWWVAYYALPDTMAGAHELARIHLGLVANHPQRRDAFMKILQRSLADIVPAFEFAEIGPAPEHERSGHA